MKYIVSLFVESSNAYGLFMTSSAPFTERHWSIEMHPLALDYLRI